MTAIGYLACYKANIVIGDRNHPEQVLTITYARGPSSEADDKILDLYNPDSEVYKIFQTSRKKSNSYWSYVTETGADIHMKHTVDPRKLCKQAGTIRIFPTLASVRAFAKSYSQQQGLFLVPVFINTDLTKPNALDEYEQLYPLTDEGFEAAKRDFR